MRNIEKYHEKLDNYRTLITRIDEHCRGLVTRYAELIACREGCSDCCRHITLFPVEAAALALTLMELPADEASHIRHRAFRAIETESCPLLEGGRCLLYRARPIICRTHGYPLLAVENGKKVIDFCPENFKGLASFPSAIIMNLDLLNATLATINSVFVASCGNNDFLHKERLSMAEALILDI